MSNDRRIVSPRIKGLLNLLGWQIFPLSIAMSAFFVVPKFRGIFRDVLGDQAILPQLTLMVLKTHGLWWLIPLLLGVLSFWAWKTAKTRMPTRLVIAATILITGVMGAVLFISLFLPFTKIIVGLQP